jgi:hypothetical protein
MPLVKSLTTNVPFACAGIAGNNGKNVAHKRKKTNEILNDDEVIALNDGLIHPTSFFSIRQFGTSTDKST